MSLLATDATRALVIAAIGLAGAAALAGCARHRAAVALMAAAVATPPLAIGYAWGSLPSAGLKHPAAAACLHALLTGLRLAPIALLVARLAPPAPLDARALHCQRLAGAGRIALAWSWLRDGAGRAWILAAAAAFVLGFAEFELASRLNVSAWSVRLFDAQAGGQSLAVTAAACAPGVLLQLLVLGAAGIASAGVAGRLSPGASPPRWHRRLGWTVAIAATLALTAVPVAAIASRAFAGDVALARFSGIGRELAAGLLFAAGGAAGAWFAAGALLAATSRLPRAARVSLLALAVAPGLCGSLVVGLAGLAAFARPSLSALSASPVPVVLALVLLALPAALALRALVDREPPTAHLAALLADDPARAGSARRLRWNARGARRWWAACALFALAYGDLAATHLLHPVDMAPALPLLYNLMHYGESPALAARLALTVAAPLLAAALGWAVARRFPVRAPALAVTHG